MTTLNNIKGLAMRVVPTNKSGQRGGLGNLIGLAIGLVTAAVVVGIGAKVTSDIAVTVNTSGNSTNVAGMTAYAAANNGTVSMGNLATYMPTIATVGAAAVIITFLIGAFAFGRGQ